MNGFRSLLVILGWVATLVCVMCAATSIGNFQMFLLFALIGAGCAIVALVCTD